MARKLSRVWSQVWSERRDFESWWAYVVPGRGQALSVLADRVSHIGGGHFRFTPSADHFVLGGGPYLNGSHEDTDALALLRELGVSLSIPDSRLRRLVLAHSSIDVLVASQTMTATHGIALRMFDRQASGPCPLEAAVGAAGYPNLDTAVYRFPRQIGLSARQGVYLVWHTSEALTERLAWNERTNDVPIVVCAFLRGKETVPAPRAVALQLSNMGQPRG